MFPRLFKSAPVAAAVAALVIAPVAWAGDAPQPRLSVQGTADLRVVPDRADVALAVEHRASQVADAQAAADKTVARVLALTDGLEIDRQQVQTTQLTVRPDYEWVGEPRRRELRGYTVTRRITVNLHDLSQLGRLMTGALSAGVNQVSPPAFDHSERPRLEREALTAAAADARARAVALAEGLGVSVGAPLSVSVGRMPAPRPMPMAAMRMSSSESADAAASYETGEMTITATVQAEFALQN